MKKVILIITGIISHYIADCQYNTYSKDSLRVIFYNTENLYDPFNDTLTMDDDFVTGEPRAWGYGKFRVKTLHIARALILAGQWQKPGLIGLCEIENRFVLNQLIRATPLKNYGYSILHYDSPDPRGVDVALLYDTCQYRLLYGRALRMINPREPGFLTRDILYAKGIIFHSDTLHLFINHWPSKYGGLAQSLEKRKFVAKKIRETIDSLLSRNPSANILLMGDFNEDAGDEVMVNILGARADTTDRDNAYLFNLMTKYKGNIGSHKYRGEWSTLDQFIVSSGLIRNKVRISGNGSEIVFDKKIMEADDNYSGHKPFRTYSGPRYIGGYSDHLPVRLDLVIRRK